MYYFKLYFYYCEPKKMYNYGCFSTTLRQSTYNPAKIGEYPIEVTIQKK